MFMLNINDLLNNLLIASPLDQFGLDDEDTFSILDYSLIDTIPGIAFIDEIFD